MVWGPRTVACFGYLALRRVGGLIKQELEENMKDTAAVTTKSIDNIEKKEKGQNEPWCLSVHRLPCFLRWGYSGKILLTRSDWLHHKSVRLSLLRHHNWKELDCKEQTPKHTVAALAISQHDSSVSDSSSSIWKLHKHVAQASSVLGCILSFEGQNLKKLYLKCVWSCDSWWPEAVD